MQKILMSKIKQKPLVNCFMDSIIDRINVVQGIHPAQDLFLSKLAQSKGITYTEAEELLGVYRQDIPYFNTNFLHSPAPYDLQENVMQAIVKHDSCLLYTSPSPRDPH